MKLYHGTSTKNAEYIEEEGFTGGELSQFTSMKKNVENGVVYFATTIEEAAEYGDAIFQVDFDLMDCDAPVSFNDGNSDHFYSPAENVNQHSDYRRIR